MYLLKQSEQPSKVNIFEGQSQKCSSLPCLSETEKDENVAVEATQSRRPEKIISKKQPVSRSSHYILAPSPDKVELSVQFMADFERIYKNTSSETSILEQLLALFSPTYIRQVVKCSRSSHEAFAYKLGLGRNNAKILTATSKQSLSLARQQVAKDLIEYLKTRLEYSSSVPSSSSQSSTSLPLESPTKPPQDPSLSLSTFPPPPPPLPPLEDTLCREVCEEVSKTWRSITKKLRQSSTNDGFKVIAAIVAVDAEGQAPNKKTSNPKPTVLSIGTGSKWIDGKQLAQDGKTVHDSHAEIIARRALLCLLYEQLSTIIEHGDQSLFSLLEPVDEGDTTLAVKYRLRSTLRLYLYISRPPCGGAQAGGDGLRVKLWKSQGEYQKAPPAHTSADYSRLRAGEQLVSFMTCSDKILLWNWVGLQGSLLSAYLSPIYLSGLIIGDSYNHELIQRALFGRVDQRKLEMNKSKLEKSYTLNRPQVGNYNNLDNGNPQSSLAPARSKFNVPISHNWYLSAKVEVINSKTGKPYFLDEQDNFSRLSKFALATRYRKLAIITSKQNQAQLGRKRLKNKEKEKLSAREELLMERFKGTYLSAKLQGHQSSVEYAQAKAALNETLASSGLGFWTKTPPQVDLFVGF